MVALPAGDRNASPFGRVLASQLVVDSDRLSSPPSLESREPPRLSPGLTRRLSSYAR